MDYARGYDEGFAGWEIPADASDAYLSGYQDGAMDSTSIREEEDRREWDDDDGLTDVEADAMTLASAGWGTEEDYGYFGDEFMYDGGN